MTLAGGRNADNAGPPLVIHCTEYTETHTLCVRGLWIAPMPRDMVQRLMLRYEEERDEQVLSVLRRRLADE